MQKRVISRPSRPLCKKSGSIDSSDRSITPTGNEVKENHLKTTNIKPVRTGVIKTPTKQTTTRALKPTSRLATPRTIKDKVSKTDSPRTPVTRSATPKKGVTSPHWKAPSKPQEGFGNARPLPGRGGPKKQKKVYNPSSLFSLCQGAVTTLVVPSEVSEDVKDVIKRRVYNQAVLATVWSTLTKDTKKNRITIETLIAERDDLSSQLSELKNTLQSRIDTLTAEHSSNLNKTTTSLVTQHDLETKKLKEDYEKTIAELRSQLSTVEERHGSEVAGIQKEHCLEVTSLQENHEKEKQDIISGHQLEVAQLESTQLDLEEQNEYLDGQIKERDENLEAEVENRLQQEVARYATIDAELRSLNDVIGMKMRENKELMNKVSELTHKAEDTQKLKHELKGIRDNNDQLRATIEMKTESERNLNVTQERLARELSLRDSDNRNMSQRCDELQFKLENYHELLAQNNIQENMFSPNHFSTPTSSPRAGNRNNSKLHSPDAINFDDIMNDRPLARQTSDTPRSRPRPLLRQRHTSMVLNIEDICDEHDSNLRKRAASADTSLASPSPTGGLIPLSFSRLPPSVNTRSVEVLRTYDKIVKKMEAMDREFPVRNAHPPCTLVPVAPVPVVPVPVAPVDDDDDRKQYWYTIPHSTEPQSPRLTKIRLKNNKFTYSKYLAFKDAATENDISEITTDNQLASTTSNPPPPPSLETLPRGVESGQETMFADMYVAIGDGSVSDHDSSATSPTEVVQTPDKSSSSSVKSRGSGSMKSRSKSESSVLGSLRSVPTNKTDEKVEEILQRYGVSKNQQQPPKTQNPIGNTSDLFMKMSKRLSRRLSFSRKSPKKDTNGVKCYSSQRAVEDYLYGRQNYEKMNTNFDYNERNY